MSEPHEIATWRFEQIVDGGLKARDFGGLGFPSPLFPKPSRSRISASGRRIGEESQNRFFRIQPG